MRPAAHQGMAIGQTGSCPTSIATPTMQGRGRAQGKGSVECQVGKDPRKKRGKGKWIKSEEGNQDRVKGKIPVGSRPSGKGFRLESLPEEKRATVKYLRKRGNRIIKNEQQGSFNRRSKGERKANERMLGKQVRQAVRRRGPQAWGTCGYRIGKKEGLHNAEERESKYREMSCTSRAV